ncbi:MAG: DMT family transporter [Spirochaetaceae bacterium]|jgi:drug/metabolite transporter (DMT)-like permease|nr:DMT family transporter [Spirochaetaceae bacterium]
MTERKKAFVQIVLCVFFWGISFVSIKSALPVYPPMSLGMLRFAIAALALHLFKRRAEKKAGKSEKLERRDLPILIAASVCGVTLYFFFENNGVKRVTVSEAAIITGAIPVITLAAEALFLRRSVLKRQWLGAVTSIAGVVLVCGVSLAISGSYAGYLFMSAAVICWILYGFATPALFSRHSRIYVVYWQTMFGFAGFVPFAVPEMSGWGSPNLEVWLHIVFLGLACSALGYCFYARSLETLGVSISALFINFIPVISIIAGVFVMGDIFLPLQWLGAVLVILGLYIAVGFVPADQRKTG